jgi:hypothetical protein
MYRSTIALLCALTIFVLSGSLLAQGNSGSKQGERDDLGFTAHSEFGGSVDSSEHTMELDSNLGYNFTKHFGINAGLPIYLIGGSNTSSTGTKTKYSTNGLGNPYVGTMLKFANSRVNYNSTVKGFAPTADTKRGLSTGRATFDWNNRFDHAFSRLTPFGEAGIANTIVDTRYFRRPFTSLGFNTHTRGGLDVDLGNNFSITTSAYAILPSGQQTIYSKLVPSSGGTTTGTTSNSNHGRVFQQNAVTVGSADIARDEGFSEALDLSPSKCFNFEITYNRSVHYALNTLSFSVEVNVGKLLKGNSAH